MKPFVSAPLDVVHGHIDLSHGAGGRATTQLVQQLFARVLHNEFLAQGDDAARLPACTGRLVMATDAHVVSPLFFPGGDIGCLSVHGTINDVAMLGAQPLYLAASFILEEGLPLADLARVVESMAAASRAAGVPIVTGDTKVVQRGKGDGIFISTTGVGVLRAGVEVSGAYAQAGDVVLLSGPIGDHGMAIMSVREGLSFDAAPGIHVLRDPTRGGLSATLNEIAQQSGVGILLHEAQIPVRPAVAAACELLGLDPLDIANEGRLLAIVPAAQVDAALAALRAHPLGREACRIGEVVADERNFVQMHTRMGGRRMVDGLSAEALPRIC